VRIGERELIDPTAIEVSESGCLYGHAVSL
jgi:hypothetical protein